MRREKLVVSHMTRLKARPRQLEVDPDSLRWTPVIVTNTVVSDADRDDDDDDEEDEEPEEDKCKEVNTLNLFNDIVDWSHSGLIIDCILLYL